MINLPINDPKADFMGKAGFGVITGDGMNFSIKFPRDRA
jgi:hypothetical protein